LNLVVVGGWWLVGWLDLVEFGWVNLRFEFKFGCNLVCCG
jgi:hypothetical protein